MKEKVVSRAIGQAIVKAGAGATEVPMRWSVPSCRATDRRPTPAATAIPERNPIVPGEADHQCQSSWARAITRISARLKRPESSHGKLSERKKSRKTRAIDTAKAAIAP
jgi:hypothetical protein